MMAFSLSPKMASVTFPVLLMQNSNSPGLEGDDDMEKGASPTPAREIIMNWPGL